MRKTLFILFFVLFPSISIYAQNKSDSLRLIWENDKEIDSVRFSKLEEYYDLYNQVYPESALISLDFYYKLAKEKNDINHLFKAAKRKGNINRLKRNYDLAMGFYDEAEVLAIQLDNPFLKADIISNKGNVFIYRQDYQKATQCFSNALKIYQNGGNVESESRMLTNLGSVFLIINNYDLALEYYQKSLSILNKIGIEDKNTAIVYVNIGWTNFEKESYDTAKSYYEKGLKILQVKNEKFFIANCYSSLARIYNKLNKLDQAKSYAKKNLALNKMLDIESGITEAEIILAQLTFETNIIEATKKGEIILNHLPSKTNKELRRDLHELLYKCYKTQKKFDLSLKMHERYNLYNDSIQLEKNNFAVAREASKNDFEIRLYESELENEKERAQLKVTQLKKTFSIISISALLIAFVLFYAISSSKKNRKRRDSLLEEIEILKNNNESEFLINSNKFELIREKIEAYIKRNLNETDWNVLTILIDDPVITNKEIAKKAFLSVDGIGSSLRRMYEYFDIKESKYKKISLLLEAIKMSNNPTSVS